MEVLFLSLSIIFLVLFITSLVAIIIGCIKPKSVIRWGDIKKRTKRNVMKYYGIPMLICSIIVLTSFASLKNVKAVKVAKAIEVVSWTDTNGKINPIRFKISNEDSTVSVIKVDKVLTINKEKLAGNHMLVYKCQSVIKGAERLYELKYELNSCKWILWKL